MIVDCAVYADGVRRDLPRDPETVAAALERDDGCFGWIGLHEPTPGELMRVQDLFGLHDLAVEDALKPHQRPKLERYDDALVLVLRTLWYVEPQDAVETGQVSVFAGRRYVVTVRHGERGGLATARQRLESQAAALGHGPAAVLWATCDSVVDGYEEVARDLEIDVDEVEASVFSPHRTRDAERIYVLKRELLEMRRAVVPLREPLEQFVHGRVAGIDPDTAPFFRDVLDHVARVSEQAESLDALLTSALNAHLARVSVQQNDDMRRISAWVAIAAVPTMIGGVYGMNFDNMPETRTRYGYFVVLAVMAIACVVLYKMFRRAGWLGGDQVADKTPVQSSTTRTTPRATR